MKNLLGDNTDFKNDNENIITANWNKVKIIFCTPSILYGVSYDEVMTHKVYGYYFKNSAIDSFSINQQLNRMRDPISFDLYIDKQFVKPQASLEACRKHIYTGHFEDYTNDKRSYSLVRSAIDELFIFDEYVKSYYGDLFYYIPYLLKKKGYTNINIVIGNSDKQKKYSEKAYNKILIDEFKKGILDKKKMDNVMIYLRSYGFDKQFINSDPELNKIEKEIRDNAMDIFIDDSGIRYLDLYRYQKLYNLL